MTRFSLKTLALLTCLGGLTALPVQARDMDDYPVVQLRALDKITARTLTFQADVGATVKFGSLYVKVQACRKAPPIEQPESAAFLQIWEERQDKETTSIGKFETHPEWVFSGWMFASSPALSYMDHPIYDVWVLDCLKEAKDSVEGEAMEGEGTVSEDTETVPTMDTLPDVPDDKPAAGAAIKNGASPDGGAPLDEE